MNNKLKTSLHGAFANASPPVVPKWIGRYVVIAPSEVHLQAFISLVADKLPVHEYVAYKTFMEEEESFENKIVFLEADYLTDGQAMKNMHNPEFASLVCGNFFSKDVIIIDAHRVISLRDMTGTTYGDAEEGITSQQVFEYWHEHLKNYQENH